jgi:cytochrome c-type biogenesis protein
MSLVFAYLAGLLTLINPCVLPVLPIVLAGALSAGRAGPLALAAGLGAGFVGVGMVVLAVGPAIGLDAERVSQVGALAMVAFGLVLLVPRAAHAVEMAAAGLAARADSRAATLATGSLRGQAAAGLLLGAVWSPCIGPTLGGAIALASQGRDLAWATAIMTAFALGVGTVVLALAYGTRAALARRGATLRRLAPVARPLLGAALLLVGLALLAGLHHRAEAWALQTLPPWLTDFSVRY